MKITIICVGKIKEDYLRQAIAEYSKRLSKFCKLEIIEIADENTPYGASVTEETLIKNKEGDRIIKYIKESAYIIALAIGGKQMDSECFAKSIESIMSNGFSNITFIIGGSVGISKDILNLAHIKLSFSLFTFPHQLMRVILLEQIYRGFKIINNEPYHK